VTLCTAQTAFHVSLCTLAVFDEPLLGQSALDRFCHRAHRFVIDGESYRKRTAPGSASASKTGQKAKA